MDLDVINRGDIDFFANVCYNGRIGLFWLVLLKEMVLLGIHDEVTANAMDWVPDPCNPKPKESERDEYIVWLAKLTEGRPFTAPVATVAILNERGEMLLERRSDNGKWSLPAGYMEPPESAEQTAIREVKEETNLDIFASALDLLTVLSGEEYVNHYSETNSTCYPVKIIFVTKKYVGEMKANEESQELRFFPPNDLPDRASSTTKYIARLLLSRTYH